MLTLNVNIDHVATIRQARGGKEPDPVTAASIAELAGASGIVSHLREDRRHINDRDVRLLREVIQTKLDLEMAAVEDIIQIALEIKPELVTIVPEKRMELTTEGGLDLTKNMEKFKSLVDRMHEKNILVSFFIEPEEVQIEAAVITNADMVELHTGVYANLYDELQLKNEIQKIKSGAEFACSSGLKVAVGHGLNYLNVKSLCNIPEINEMSIGHSIISRAVLVGLDRAVHEMLDIMNTSSLHTKIK
ncbi:MAG: pyridoxine 5'-phosphate synthase [FCB group bacterium]|jgi:pyridoxine 5-phosphate synthase